MIMEFADIHDVRYLIKVLNLHVLVKISWGIRRRSKLKM